MKRLLFLLLSLPIIASAQEITESPNIPVDSATNTIEYRETIKLDTISKEQLFTCARKWFNKSFETGHCEVTMADYNSGHLMGKGTIFGKHLRGLVNTPFTVSFVIEIFVRNGKYRYVVSDFNILAGINGEMMPDWVSANYFATDPKFKNKKGEYTGLAKQNLGIIDANIHYIINNLKDALATKAYSSKFIADF